MEHFSVRSLSLSLALALALALHFDKRLSKQVAKLHTNIQSILHSLQWNSQIQIPNNSMEITFHEHSIERPKPIQFN